MNNDFEKNINPEEKNALSESDNIQHNDSEVLYDRQSVPDNDESKKYVPEAEEYTVISEEQQDADIADEPEDEVVPDTVYNEQSDLYSYSKRSSSDEEINGCIWDKTEQKKLKTRNSGRGFKVFVAVMLAVFTVSAASIAAFMAFDYIDDLKAEDAAKTANDDGAIKNISPQTAAFKDEEGVYTKRQVAAKCAPSAVGIVVEMKASSGGYYDFGFFGNYYSNPQVVQAAGSGFIYSADGYIITNHHVIEGAEKITVYLNDKTELEAELVGSDSLSDIAVIKVNPEGINLVPMEIGNSSELVVGDEVIAIGCPAGIEYMGTVTDGIISAINRDVSLTDSGSTKTMTLLQTNATINKGNSGGPLINSKGQVIGINTLKLSSNYEGIGFSIPINGALPIISQLIEHGSVIERSENDFVYGEGVIGISASAITESEAEYYDIPVGVLVIQIDKESSAAKAGLRRGDIITAYNGKKIKTVEELNSYKSSNRAGEEVTISVYRDSAEEGSETFDITFKLDSAT